MPKHCHDNERIKREYLAYLKEAKRHNVSTVDAVAKSLHRFEEYTKFRNFKAFHYQQAIAFKNHLSEQKYHLRDTEPTQTFLSMAGGTIRL